MRDSQHRTKDGEKSETARQQEATGGQQDESDNLSDALEDSFPASDPPSMTQPKTKPGAPKGNKSVHKPGVKPEP